MVNLLNHRGYNASEIPNMQLVINTPPTNDLSYIPMAVVFKGLKKINIKSKTAAAIERIM